MLSRSEEILQAILEEKEYTEKPESRMEALLIGVAELIKSGGASPEEIQAAVNSYLVAHPEMVTGLDEALLEKALKEVFN